MTKKWIRTKPRRARPTATLLQRTRSPTTPSTCGTRTTWSSLCPTTRTPRSARCWWLPSPTSPLSSRTARRVTTPWTSPAARPQPKGSTSRGRCDFWCKGIATANSLDDQGAPRVLETSAHARRMQMWLRSVWRGRCRAVCRNPVTCFPPLPADVQHKITRSDYTVSFRLVHWRRFLRIVQPDVKTVVSHTSNQKSRTPGGGEPRGHKGITGEDHWTFFSMCLSFREELMC